MRVGVQTIRTTVQRWLFVATLTACIAGGVSAAFGQQWQLDNLVLDSSQGGHVRVRFGVQCPVEPLKQLLTDEGATVRVGFEAALRRERLLLWEKQEAVARRLYYLKSRALSQEYELKGEGLDKPLVGTELAPLLDKAWSTLEMDLGAWHQLQPGSEYVVDLRIECDRADVPVWLRRALFFWSWDVLPPRTYRLRFRY